MLLVLLLGHNNYLLSNKKLTLKNNITCRHEMLQKFLSRGVLMPMDIYLHTGKPMKTPSPRGCRMCQGYLMDA